MSNQMTINKYKIATLEKKTTADGTLSNPLKVEGKPLIS